MRGTICCSNVAQMCCMQHNPKKGELVSSGYDLDVLCTLCVRSKLGKIGMECFFSNPTPDDGKGEKGFFLPNIQDPVFSPQIYKRKKRNSTLLLAPI